MYIWVVTTNYGKKLPCAEYFCWNEMEARSCAEVIVERMAFDELISDEVFDDCEIAWDIDFDETSDEPKRCVATLMSKGKVVLKDFVIVDPIDGTDEFLEAPDEVRESFKELQDEDDYLERVLTSRALGVPVPKEVTPPASMLATMLDAKAQGWAKFLAQVRGHVEQIRENEINRLGVAWNEALAEIMEDNVPHSTARLYVALLEIEVLKRGWLKDTQERIAQKLAGSVGVMIEDTLKALTEIVSQDIDHREERENPPH